MIDFVSTLMILAHAAACLIIVWLSLCNINRMTPTTRHGVRAAVVLIATGAFSALAADLIFTRTPGLAEWLLTIGVATGLLADRRSAACPCAFQTTNRTPSHG